VHQLRVLAMYHLCSFHYFFLRYEYLPPLKVLFKPEIVVQWVLEAG
jgi:hypothetical protein